MTTSALPTFITNVLAALNAAPALSGVRIFDGPEIDTSYPNDWIAVGHDGSDDGDFEAAAASQEYAPIGALRKNEDGALSCVLSTWDGTTDITARRVRAFALLAAVEDVVRADPSFSGAVLWAGLESFQLQYRQTNQGAAVEIPFSLTYRARI